MIEYLRRLYNKDLLRKFLLTTNVITNEDVIKIHRKLNLKECRNVIASVWLNVKPKALREAWGKLLLREVEKNEKLESSGNETDEVIAMLHKIPGCNDCDQSSA